MWAGAGIALLAIGWLCLTLWRGNVGTVAGKVRALPLVGDLGTHIGEYNAPPCRDEDDIGPGQPKPYCGDLPSLAAVNVREVALDTVSEGFRRPWAFEFINASEVLVTEFEGSLRRLDTVTGELVTVAGLPDRVPDLVRGEVQAGLLDLALHPGFADNGLVYFSHAVTDGEQRYALAVSRAKLENDSLHDIERIFLSRPWEKSKSNFGGALLFDDAGHLFITVGDRSVRSNAQHPGLLAGKVVRLRDDGSIPDDNPFLHQADTHDPALYALGVRNPQGLVRDPATGLIYGTEHGPMGGDEVNVIEAGKNYGWPVITYGLNYTYKPIGEGTVKEGLEQPLFYYLPSLAISPIEIYHGEMFPEWDGDLLVGTLKRGGISKLDLLGGRILSESPILGELQARIRDIKVAPDSSIWVLTESGSLYRLWREANPVRETLAVGQRDGETIYLLVCAGCHDRNVPGVPQLADKADWTERLEKDPQAWYRNTLQGYKGMPEKGLCEDCTGDELKRAVVFMRGMLKN